MKPAKYDSRSLMAEWSERPPAGSEQLPKATTEAERAEALREYEQLVNQIDDVVREHTAQQRTTSR